MEVSFSPDGILCGWLGLKQQLTNSVSQEKESYTLSAIVCICFFSNYKTVKVLLKQQDAFFFLPEASIRGKLQSFKSAVLWTDLNLGCMVIWVWPQHSVECNVPYVVAADVFCSRWTFAITYVEGFVRNPIFFRSVAIILACEENMAPLLRFFARNINTY